MISPVLLVGAAFAAKASAACSRPMLQDATAAYIKAQTAGKPDTLPLAGNASYVENDSSMSVQKGVLVQPIKIDFERSLYDTTQCTTFTELTAANTEHPYVIATRLYVSDEKITGIQSVVSDAGDWLFNATVHLRWAKEEKWDPIPESERDSRAVIQAAGDAYLDSWGNGSIPVPYGTPCARLEGGIYTGERNVSSNSCRMPEFPQPFKITKRSHVVDEVIGAVGIFNDFPFIDVTRPNGTSSTNLVRVERGMIRYIHEITVCATRNCGR